MSENFYAPSMSVKEYLKMFGTITPAKKPKYHNAPCVVGGEKYRSSREMRRHGELLLMKLSGLIGEVRREVPYALAETVKIQGRWRPALRYVADFVYTDLKTGDVVVEDCKGFRTEGYRIKRHLMAAIHNIEILET